MSTETNACGGRNARSVPADPEIIATLVGTLSADELQRVAAVIQDVLRDRELGWVRHSSDPRWFHAILAYAGGSIALECVGRMSSRDDYELEARPAVVDRCAACRERRAQRGLIEAGLVELVANTGGI